MSPYLFILCAEGLSALINKYESQGLIHGIKISRQAPSVSHLLFTDDSYLFSKVSDTEAMRIIDLLQIYKEASGQRVNMTKSSVFFSTNVAREIRSSNRRILQMNEGLKIVRIWGSQVRWGETSQVFWGFLKIGSRREFSHGRINDLAGG